MVGRIPGWSGILEIGYGPNYNPKWTEIQIISLSAKNGESGRDLEFDDETKWVEEPEAPAKKYTYILTFKYAAREGKPLSGGRFEVFWGGKSLGVITPTDYEIHTQEFEIDVVSGKTNLKFKGLGGSDDYGTGITLIKIISNKGSEKEFVIPIKNGDFSKPNVGTTKKIGKVPGWSGVLEVGYGPNYNSKWTTVQILELNAKSGDSGKDLKFDDDLKWVEKSDDDEPETTKYTYTLVFQYAAR